MDEKTLTTTTTTTPSNSTTRDPLSHASSITNRHQRLQQASSLLANLVSACAIVFANKAVLSVLNFRFTVALTCIQTVGTWLVSSALAAAGIIVPKKLPKQAAIALAAAFTGYIILCNVSLFVNTVGFYQLTKIAIAPTVMIMEAISLRRAPTLGVAICVFVVCAGIGMATVFDAQVMTNLPGLVVGVASVVVSAQYGTWIGSMTRQHDVTPLQLLHQYLPYASLMMAACVPVESAVLMVLGGGGGSSQGGNGGAASSTSTATTTLWTFHYTHQAIAMIALSTVLGAVVTFSTFLVIGNTSALTYAVAGHIKTIVILGGGALLFGDQISPVKGLGICIALAGVFAYTYLKTRAASPAPKKGG